MVSFQCNGCGDVLTKPKLDKHRATCHSSFDCIDCSKRFETPADYKEHTSCISEAEKYQKTVYNGKNGPEGKGRNQQWRQQGGGRQRGNNRPQWQQRNVSRATGANETPLGTPARMSPVNGTPLVEENPQESQPAVETSKKRKAEPEITESKDTSEPTKKKKRKQKNTEDVPETTEVEMKSRTNCKSTSDLTTTKRPLHDPNFQPVEDGNGLKEVSEKKKKKKESKKKEAKGDEKEEARKEKRKKRKDLPSSGPQPNPGQVVDAKVTVEPPVTEINEEEARLAKRSRSKVSKPKLKVAAVGEAVDVPTPDEPSRPVVLEVARDDQGDRKKRRTSDNRHRDGGDEKWVAQGNDGNLREKHMERKKKRKSGGQAVGVVE